MHIPMKCLALPLIVLFLAPAVVAQQADLAADDLELTIQARNIDCPDGRQMCLEVTEGDIEGIQPGDNVIVRFMNEGQIPHNLHVAEWTGENQTGMGSDDAIAATSTLQPGQEENLTFQAPADADGLYFWCNVPGHEGLGMWLEAPYADAEPTPAPADPLPRDEDTPLPLMVLLAALAVALVAGRRRP